MKVFAIKFTGYWPVGACAVVVAEDEVKASRSLMLQLSSMGLVEKQRSPLDIQEIDTSKSGNYIIIDGEY